MRKLMVRAFFGECFLIFWNIFMVSMEDDHTTIWEKETPNDFIAFFNDRAIIDLDHDLREYITDPQDDIKRFVYHHNGSESQSISFIISPCKTAEIQWILKYTPENETSEVSKQNIHLETLAEYRGTELYIYVGKALRGLYFLDLSSTMNRLTYFLYVTMDPMAAELLRRVKEKKIKPIRFKKSLKTSSLTFKWPEWSWKNEVFPYVVMWNNKKYTTSACEREIYSSHLPYLTTKNKTYELSDDEAVIPGATYYVSVFIKIRIKDNFLLPYLQGSVTYPRNNPVTLKDGIPIRKKLTPDDDKLTFRYKVRNRQFPGSENEILWYVISCVGAVQIEINHRKDPVLKKQVVTRYKAFKISQPNIGNRYVLKVTDTTGESETGAAEENVEIFATMRSKLFPFPNITNFDLQLFRNQNYTVKNKTSYTVAWFAASDKKPVHYCMRVYSKRDEENNNIWDINQCTNMKKKFNSTGGFVMRNCTKSGNSEILTLPIYDLDPLTDYVVYVSARKQGFKRRLWYNTLHIPGNDFFPGLDLSTT